MKTSWEETILKRFNFCNNCGYLVLDNDGDHHNHKRVNVGDILDFIRAVVKEEKQEFLKRKTLRLDANRRLVEVKQCPNCDYLFEKHELADLEKDSKK